MTDSAAGPLPSPVQHAVAKIIGLLGRREVELGTGFLVSRDRVLTCWHVVGAVPEDAEIHVLLADGRVRQQASIDDRHRSEVDDWVALRLKDEVGLQPIQLAPLERSDSGRLWAFGYPSASSGASLTLPLRVDNPHQHLGSAPAMELFSDVVAAAGGLRAGGLSGAPCLALREQGVVVAVGLIRQMLSEDGALASGGKLFATPSWHLIEQVSDLASFDPCLGLPDPVGQELPDEPFRYFQRYSESDAPLFFGRCAEIREALSWIDRAENEDSIGDVLLVSGASGVGKSSFLRAGITSRARRRWAITLVDAVPGADLAKALDAKIPSGESQRLIVLDQLEGWIRSHSRDQREGFLAWLRSFDDIRADGQRTRSRLILSLRKEWYPEARDLLRRAGISWTELLLRPLDRRSIVEVVRGIANTASLRSKYRARIEPSLPEQIASDLLSDPELPVAPALQVLLAEMWRSASAAGGGRRLLTTEIYLDQRRIGFHPRAFARRQLKALEGVSLGLALDMLEFHVDREHHMSALIRSDDELTARYPECGRFLQQAREILSDRSLLAVTSSGTRLAHDTLGPVVVEAFDASMEDAQRACRAMEAAIDAQRHLSSMELEFVRSARQEGVRGLTEPEAELVADSEASERRQRSSQTLFRIAVTASVSLAIIALVFWRMMVLESERKRLVLGHGLLAEAEGLTAQGLTREALGRVDEAANALGRNDIRLRILRARIAQLSPPPMMELSAACGAVTDVRFLDGDRKAVSLHWRERAQGARGEGVLVLWDLVLGKKVRQQVVPCPAAPLSEPIPYDANSIAISKDGRELFYGGPAGTVHRFNVSDFSPAGDSLPLHDEVGGVAGLALSPDGRLLAIGGLTGRVVVADVETASISRRFTDQSLGSGASARAHQITAAKVDSHPVTALGFEPSGRFLVTGGHDGTIKIWGVGDGELESTFDNGEVPEEVLALDCSTSRVAWGSYDPHLREGALGTRGDGAAVVDASAHRGPIWSVAFSGGGEYIATASEDRAVVVWDSSDKRVRRRLTDHESAVRCVAFSADRRTLISGTEDGVVRVWGFAEEGAMVHRLREPDRQRAVFAVRYAPDDRSLLLGGAELSLVDCSTGMPLRRFQVSSSVAAPDSIRDAVWISGSEFLTGGRDPYLRLWSVREVKSIVTVESVTEGTRRRINGIARSIAGDSVCVGTTQNEFRIYQLDALRAGGDVGSIVRPHDSWVRCVTYGHDDVGRPLLVAGDSKGALVVRNVSSGLIWTDRVHDRGVNAVLFDGEKFVSASSDGTVKKWAWTGQRAELVGEFDGSNSSVLCVALAFEGQVLVTGGRDGRVRLWDYESCRQLYALDGHRAAVFSVAVDSSGLRLASASNDGAVYQWHLGCAEALSSARHRLGPEQSDDAANLSRARYYSMLGGHGLAKDVLREVGQGGREVVLEMVKCELRLGNKDAARTLLETMPPDPNGDSEVGSYVDLLVDSLAEPK
ncbi:MAG: trypsin-like peptidase domain-containing protein [bacterium]|nr:trypsin-like peptidase domain-containing protein [bacterium]